MMLPQVLKNSSYLDYRNEEVLFHFSCMYNLPESEIEELFQETKKYIAICTQPGIYINNDMLIIEEMWRSFILFTSVYSEFCQRFFCRFIHHTPILKRNKRIDPEPNSEFSDKEKELLINTVYVLCGEKTVSKWFKEYPEKYTKEYIKSIQK
ncbi:hypothetical protein C8J95_104154 [Elizabethkingia sp. YR214]|uniref:hypothetical protein n=1 Tax=Elizabethkingia sp. YR214 TaxID=2135667 RepID=UPI000D4DA29F|nr:hypothetical protein [Elizabethkingia sp. YR214]PUB32752.1 hypothetical protein C8J95_104154 [Elizabethkingia sp. YR214]